MSGKLCVNCQKNNYDRQRGKSDKLCLSCLRTLPRKQCLFCKKDFRATNSDDPNNDKCKKCIEDLDLFGFPKSCVHCRLSAAFDGERCRHCKTCFNKYGIPLSCEECKMVSAFRKPKKIIG